MPVVLLTGFAPFGGESVNPSFEIAKALAGQLISGHEVVVRELPCVFGQALEVLDQALDEARPAVVIALGQAESRQAISVERVAINVDDARIPDNAGAQPIDRPVVPGGPAAHFSTLPVKAIVAALREAGLPAEVSQTAGTYVCNHVFYGLQHRLAGVRVPAGFIHVPLMDTQAARRPGGGGMPLEDMIRGARLAIEVSLAHLEGRATLRADDPRAIGGAID